VSRQARTVIDEPRLAVLGGVGEEVEHHLREALGVAVHAQSAARHALDADAVRARLEQRTRHLHRAQHGVGDLDGALAQVDLAARDARDVEQVVDQPRQVRGLTLERGEFGHRGAAQPHQLDGGRDRRQRIAQLVAEHRQELVLGAVGGLGVELRFPLAREQQLALQRVLAPHAAQGDLRIHLCEELLRGEGLDDVVVGARRHAVGARLLAGARREQNHRQLGGLGPRLDRLQEAQAVETRHHHVGDHEIESRAARSGRAPAGRRPRW
jgi:hypothetical protein